jgi:hypothetical protein
MVELIHVLIPIPVLKLDMEMTLTTPTRLVFPTQLVPIRPTSVVCQAHTAHTAVVSQAHTAVE